MKTITVLFLLAFQISAVAQNSTNFVPTLDSNNQSTAEDPNLRLPSNPDGSPHSEGSVFVPAIDPNCGPCREKYLKAGKKRLSDAANKNLSQRARGQFVPGSPNNTSPGKNTNKQDANVGN